MTYYINTKICFIWVVSKDQGFFNGKDGKDEEFNIVKCIFYVNFALYEGFLPLRKIAIATCTIQILTLNKPANCLF